MYKLLMTSVFFILLLNNGQGQNVSMTLEKGQPDSVVFVLAKANWCKICLVNEERIKKEVLSKYENDEKMKVLIVDLSNDSTKFVSLQQLKSIGMEGFIYKYHATGVLYWLDANTKQLINKISVSKETENINNKIKETINQ